ncbi:unnamed protein product, partial [Musa banksii]
MEESRICDRSRGRRRSDDVVGPLLDEGSVIHGFAWHVVVPRGLVLPPYEPGRVPDDRGPRGHVDEDDGPGTDLGPLPYPDVAEDGSAGSDEDAVADLRVAVADGLAGAAECDVVEDGDVVADHGGLADDDAGGVVEEDALADAGGGVDVDGENVGDAGLEGEGEGAAVLGPEKVGHAVSLDGEEALVVEEAVGEGDAGGVAVANSEEVGDDGGDEGGLGGEGLEEEVVEEGGEESGGAEFVGEVEGEGEGQGVVGEHRGVEEARQRRLRIRVSVGLRLDLRPHPRLLRLRLRRRVRRDRVPRSCRRGRGGEAVLVR